MERSRRWFLGTWAAATVGFGGLRELYAKAPAGGGYGALVKDPKGMLDLPKGFSYRIISKAGQRMDDGLVLPGKPDGMATFKGPNNLTILIRNHELTPVQQSAFGRRGELASKVPAAKFYDRGLEKLPCAGGTTTLIYDTAKQKVLRQFLSLAGTTRNCAGGLTPWGSWVTCEETMDRAGKHKKYTCIKDHGYNFEVPATMKIGLADPVPLKAMGRFNHEAIAVDPKSGAVYQTEDRGDGLIYRFLPTKPGNLAAGGKLQCLALAGKPSASMQNWGNGQAIPVGKTLPVRWIDLDNVESPKDDLRFRGFKAGGARFARGEGMWYAADGIYFACTSGGRAKSGQIWRYVPSPVEATDEEKAKPGTLELFVEPNDPTIVHNADNLTVAPWGDLIVCEDRSGDTVRLVGVTPKGQLYTFAHHHKRSEFAGATFSPDGTTLFVNIQGPGLTLAITGGFPRP